MYINTTYVAQRYRGINYKPGDEIPKELAQILGILEVEEDENPPTNTSDDPIFWKGVAYPPGEVIPRALAVNMGIIPDPDQKVIQGSGIINSTDKVHRFQGINYPPGAEIPAKLAQIIGIPIPEPAIAPEENPLQRGEGEEPDMEITGETGETVEKEGQDVDAVSEEIDSEPEPQTDAEKQTKPASKRRSK